tara:strand:+ start:495 stop:674 length:180 start_codon:yes stop_codon:yes gene_type:complete
MMSKRVVRLTIDVEVDASNDKSIYESLANLKRLKLKSKNMQSYKVLDAEFIEDKSITEF